MDRGAGLKPASCWFKANSPIKLDDPRINLVIAAGLAPVRLRLRGVLLGYFAFAIITHTGGFAPMGSNQPDYEPNICVLWMR